MVTNADTQQWTNLLGHDVAIMADAADEVGDIHWPELAAKAAANNLNDTVILTAYAPLLRTPLERIEEQAQLHWTVEPPMNAPYITEYVIVCCIAWCAPGGEPVSVYRPGKVPDFLGTKAIGVRLAALQAERAAQAAAVPLLQTV